MKKKSILIEVIALCFIATLIFVIYFALTHQSNEVHLAKYEVANMQEMNDPIPEFSIGIRGLYTGTITNKTLQDKVKMYEFDAAIDDGFSVITNHYTGIKLTDVLNATQISNYEGLELNSNDRIFKFFAKEEMDGNTFLIFTKDGQKINNATVSVISFDWPFKYSLIDLYQIYVSDYTYPKGGA